MLIISIILLYIIASLWETIVHWKILHAKKNTYQNWGKLGGVFGKLRKGWFSHNRVHHNYTFKKSQFIQFESEKEQKILNRKLPEDLKDLIIDNRYGLSVSSFWEITTFVSVPLVFSIILLYYIDYRYIPIGIFIAVLPMLLSKYLHPLLHMPQEILEKNRFSSWLSNTSYFKYIQESHLLHHKYGLCNFNLLPAGDYILGVYKKE